MGKNQDKILAIVCVLLLVLSAGYFYLTTSPKEEIESDIILSATRDYTYPAKNTNRYITAESLNDLITDDNDTNDPYIISIRGKNDYAIGHIPRAVNIDPRIDIFTEENLNELPKDRQIVVYCYTGHTASQATALLNVMGYNAWSLKWGMCSWTNDSTIAANKYFTGTIGYPTEPETIVVATGNSFEPLASIKTIPVKEKTLPALGESCSDPVTPASESETDTTETTESEVETLRKASYKALAKPPVTKADALWNLLNDSIDTNDPYILDLRVHSEGDPDYFTNGHIAGAVNIGIGNLFTDEGLAKLPEDKNKHIVVVCYTGHTASQATALLNLNGYNATTLMWGMCGWSTKTDVTGSKCFNLTAHSHNYDCEEGAYDEETRVTFQSSLDTSVVTASTLYGILTDDNPDNDTFILSIRKPDVYMLGHIPGAINIPTSSLFTKKNLSELPFNKEITVVCYTGHTASQVTALLNALGYDATALKYGMCGWCANTTIAPKGFDRTEPNYPICTGSEPGTMDEAKTATLDV